MYATNTCRNKKEGKCTKRSHCALGQDLSFSHSTYQHWPLVVTDAGFLAHCIACWDSEVSMITPPAMTYHAYCPCSNRFSALSPIHVLNKQSLRTTFYSKPGLPKAYMAEKMLDTVLHPTLFHAALLLIRSTGAAHNFVSRT